VDLGDLGGLDDVGEAGIGVGGDEVLVDGAREEVGFLRNYSVVLPKLVGRKAAQVAVAKFDCSLLGLGEAGQQLGGILLPEPGRVIRLRPRLF
jgi:hypothetical protein